MASPPDAPAGPYDPSADNAGSDTVSLTALHDLYRHCQAPLTLYTDTVELLSARGLPVNYVDDTGLSPLSLLVLHINRGLRYHMYPVAKIAACEETSAPGHVTAAVCAEVDREYQEQVYKILVLLLESGADVNFIPASCPGIPYDATWSENYEHKIMQSDQRWNLFSFGGSMEYTTYSIFNPLTRHRPVNDKQVSILHLAAWRGDAGCIKLLLEHHADVHQTTTDGRNALHFLYLYCNKPRDLATATQLLVQYGIDVNARDTDGNSPLHVLLNHFLVKRSHVRYLANTYTADNIAASRRDEDNYRDAIKLTIEVLLEARADVNAKNRFGDCPLHYLYTRFEHSLRSCEPDFQVKGHYLVPYSFSVRPLWEFTRYLLELGCKVNERDAQSRAPLHCLVSALKNLSLDDTLNPTRGLCDCFRALTQGGADVNITDANNKTPLHHLVELICTTRHALPRYLPVLTLLVDAGAVATTTDHRGNSPLHTLLGSGMKQRHMQELLVFLLRCGADPSTPNDEKMYPLNALMRQHLHHHDPLSYGGVPLTLDAYLATVDTVCKAMTSSSLSLVFSVYRASGFWGVICETRCPVYTLLHQRSSSTRSLRETARLVTLRAMGGRGWKGWETLPLPEQLKRYVSEIVS